MIKELTKKAFTSDSGNGFIWNAIGGSLFAGQSVILLFLCARIYGQETSGVVSLSYAIATLVFIVALYGVRNFQVTDIKETYKFFDYILLRIMSVVFAIILLTVYMLFMYRYNGYSIHKCATIIAMSLLKLVNATEDVFIGRFQQKGYFVVGARIGAIREFISLIAISIAICLRSDIIIALGGGLITGVVIEFILVTRAKAYLDSDTVHMRDFNIDRLKDLVRNCSPLCVSTALAIYLSNIPKYVTDWYLDEIKQAIVGYLILPAFTIALLNQFIYTPFIKGLGDLWNEGDRKGFIKRIILQTMIIVSSAAIILLISYLIGIPLLSAVYSIDLSPYIKEFVLLLIGGGLYALEYYLIIPITVMHEQGKIVISYAVAIIISLLIQNYLVSKYELIGVGIVYILVNFIISLLLAVVICLKYNSEMNKEGNNL